VIAGSAVAATIIGHYVTHEIEGRLGTIEARPAR
jgi:hypothetical protein